MRTFILTLCLFSILFLGINAQNCTRDADCATQSTKTSCCFNPIFATGQCYDKTTDVCAACYCNQPGSMCSGDVNLLCSIALYGPDAECCAGLRQCINPAVNECCSYNGRHSSSPQGVICPVSDTGVCCGANCQDEETQQCCQVITSIIEYYPAPKDRLCCGLYNTCDGQTQTCQRITSFPYGQCINKTTTNPGSDGSNADANADANADGSNADDADGNDAAEEGQCSSQACCDAQANPNPQTGTGYLQYVESCKQGGQDCVGNSGCKLCFNAASGAENYGNRAVCNFGDDGEEGDDDGEEGNDDGEEGDDGENTSGCNDQACCDAQSNPNPQTGDGYLQYEESCKQGGQDCVGTDGCKLCFKAAAGVPNNTGRPQCNY